MLTLSAGELVDTESMAEYAEYSTVLRLLRWLDFGVVLPLAVLGVYLTRSRWRSLGILYALLAALELTLIAFYVVSRYRFPLAPILLLFAAVPLEALGRMKVEARQWVPGIVAALVFALASRVSLVAVSNTTHDNIGAALVQAGRAADAVPVLQRAVAIVPADARAHYDLGVAFERTGASPQALEEFRTAVRLRPDLAEAQDALGSSERAAGHSTEAAAHFAEAVRLRPDYAEAHGNLAAVLAESGRTDEAIEHFRTALALQPNNFGTHANLGDLLFSLHRPGEAIQEYVEADRLAPQDPDTKLMVLGRLAQAYADANRKPETIGTLDARWRSHAPRARRACGAIE